VAGRAAVELTRAVGRALVAGRELGTAVLVDTVLDTGVGGKYAGRAV
jgi:hypothetical protein